MTTSTTLEQARVAAGAHVVQLEMGATAYHVQGERGPWVVLVNGLLTPMFAWEPLSAMLAGEGFRVLRYDHPGRGLSDRPRLRYEPALYVRQLEQLAERLQIERMQIVCWSMGAVIATRFAQAHPDRVESLTLIAPALFLKNPLKARLLTSFALGRRLLARGTPRVIRTLDRQHLLYPELLADYRARLSEQLRFPGVEESFVSTLQNFARGMGHELQSVGEHARPVLIVWGDQDRTTPYRNAEPVRRLFPRARFLPVPGARHGVHLDHREQVYPELCSFLAGAQSPRRT